MPVASAPIRSAGSKCAIAEGRKRSTAMRASGLAWRDRQRQLSLWAETGPRRGSRRRRRTPPGRIHAGALHVERRAGAAHRFADAIADLHAGRVRTAVRELQPATRGVLLVRDVRCRRATNSPRRPAAGRVSVAPPARHGFRILKGFVGASARARSSRSGNRRLQQPAAPRATARVAGVRWRRRRIGLRRLDLDWLAARQRPVASRSCCRPSPRARRSWPARPRRPAASRAK